MVETDHGVSLISPLISRASVGGSAKTFPTSARPSRLPPSKTDSGEILSRGYWASMTTPRS